MKERMKLPLFCFLILGILPVFFMGGVQWYTKTFDASVIISSVWFFGRMNPEIMYRIKYFLNRFLFVKNQLGSIPGAAANVVIVTFIQTDSEIIVLILGNLTQTIINFFTHRYWTYDGGKKFKHQLLKYILVSTITILITSVLAKMCEIFFLHITASMPLYVSQLLASASMAQENKNTNDLFFLSKD